jgi:hypothetical protein
MKYWLNTIWPPLNGENHYFTNISAQDRSKKAVELLGQDDLVFFYETKTGPNDKYPWLFCWDDGDGLLNYLKTNFHISFSKSPSIEKDTITLSNGRTTIRVGLNLGKKIREKEYEAILNINDEKTINVYMDIENGERNIYSESTNKKPRMKGRFGIIALVKSKSKKFKENDWYANEYVDRDPINWKWSAEAEIIHVGGFVPQKVVCKIMGKEPNYFFRGWGINDITEIQFIKICEYYVTHSAPWLTKEEKELSAKNRF